jgi:hypothetical protein
MKEPDPVRFPFLGGGVIEFMFNRKEARLDPCFNTISISPYFTPS